ncbi:MAG: hypothetical protein AB1567_07350 [bacterium]
MIRSNKLLRFIGIGIIFVLFIGCAGNPYRNGWKYLEYKSKGITFYLDKEDNVHEIAVFSSIDKSNLEKEDNKLRDKDLIIPGVCAGGIRIGDTIDNVIRVFGRPRKIKIFEKDIVVYYYKDWVVVEFRSEEVSRIRLSSEYLNEHKEIHTIEGIKYGDNEEKVLSIYGEPALGIGGWWKYRE